MLESIGSLIKPQKILFDTEDDIDKFGNFKIRQKFGYIIPLDAVLKTFLELPTVFDSVQNYYFNLINQKEDTIYNIVQTNFWKSKLETNSDKITFPLFAYEDGYETGNPLGSHAGVYNLNAIYVIFPCLPVEFRSKLDNIFLAQLYHADDGENTDKKIIYGRLIDDLNKLNSEGIEICDNGKKTRVYFKLILILGDNLALNDMLGFVKGFNAKYFCRFCRASSDKTCKMCSEISLLLRTKINYHQNDIKIQNPKTTGVHSSCVMISLISMWLKSIVSISYMTY